MIAVVATRRLHIEIYFVNLNVAASMLFALTFYVSTWSANTNPVRMKFLYRRNYCTFTACFADVVHRGFCIHAVQLLERLLVDSIGGPLHFPRYYSRQIGPYPFLLLHRVRYTCDRCLRLLGRQRVTVRGWSALFRKPVPSLRRRLHRRIFVPLHCT